MSKKILWVVFVFCALAFQNANAQTSHWVKPCNQILPVYVPRVLYEDTAADVLCIGTGGGFYIYDGNSYQLLGQSLGSGAILSIIRYNGTYYVGSLNPAKQLCKWNGTSWDTTGINADGSVGAMCIYNGDLYVGGQFAHIGGISARGLAKFDGTNWSGVANYPMNSNYYEISTITSYNGKLYVGGQIADSLGNIVNVLRWDGEHWHDLGTGIGSQDVEDMDVCNNILYMGGYFTMANGQSANYIAQWDGTTLSDVGGGVMGIPYGNGQVHTIKTFHNELYVGGVFNYAGGVPAEYVAKWDGTNWCGTNDTLDNVVLSLGIFRDTLYMAGAFWYINSDTIRCIAKWIGGNFGDTCGNTTGIESNFQANDFSIFPNPSAGNFTLQLKGFDQNDLDIKIIDVLGQTVMERKEEKVFGTWQDNFDLSGISDGIYFVNLTASGGRSETKGLIIRK